ncbi:MAG: dihydrodipicolinate synthase family protein [Eubacteriales bacterium]|nr:dihydrodipicolinate synthase family protein [Eubacteriales bacterium]
MTDSRDKYQGIIPAFYACYDESGDISQARCQALARHLLAQGVGGLYVNGSSGECIYLSVEERKKVLEAVMEAVGGKLTIIAHVACNNTRDSMELARHAQALGVDAIAAIPPIYFRLPEEAIARYWNDISGAAPDTDFVIYNIPQLAGVALTPGLYQEMINNPRVKAVKNSSMPVQDIEVFKTLGRGKVAVFNGPDEQFVAGRVMGADGGIGGTYAVMPRLFIKADDFIHSGSFEGARAIQVEINRVIAALLSGRCDLYAMLKEVLRQKGIVCGSVRAPLMPLQEGDAAIARQIVKMIAKTERGII